MAKIVTGVALAAGSIALMAVNPAIGILATLHMTVGELGLMGLSMGASMTLGGIAEDMRGGPGYSGSMRQPAAARECVYGTVRKNGVVLYTTTTGHQLNQIIAWAGHKCQSIDAVYLDGREFHGNPTWTSNDWYLYGDGQTYQDASGNNYSFGSEDVIGNSALGDAAGYWYAALNAQNTSYWQSDCTLNGICASYIKLKYDANRFSGTPGIKATIHGKADIFDPRTGTTGWSNNAALCIANFLCDKEFGIGCDYATEIDEDALIAAANICDEYVLLASGGSERRYTINGVFDTNSTPGDILDSMLMACEGRISYSGGKWKIYPAAWYGSDLQFDQNHITGAVKWTPVRKLRERFNRVRATYVCPVYPYATSGYDQDHKDPNIFSGEWQPTDAPEYAQDSRHGYSSDVNLAEDGGTPLYTNRRYQFVTSCSQAQRLMKIYLMRNRKQGSGTLPMNLAAYKTQAQNVIQVSFPGLSWTNKYLEVQEFHFAPKIDPSGKDAPTLGCELQVVETSPAVYSWSTAEERGVEDTASPAVDNTVDAPSGLILQNDDTTAIMNADGTSIARVLVSWTAPDDPFVTSGGSIQIQYQLGATGTIPSGPLRLTDSGNGTYLSTWIDAPSVSGIATNCYIQGVSGFSTISVRIRSVRASGATSAWVATTNAHLIATPQPIMPVVPIGGTGIVIKFPISGHTLDALEPAEAGADRTSNNTAHDTNNVAGVAAAIVRDNANNAAAQATAAGEAAIASAAADATDKMNAAITEANQTAAGMAASESIIPNGGFTTGDATGWGADNGSAPGTYGTLPDGNTGLTLAGGGANASAFTRAIQVTPGRKYKIGFRVYAGSGTQHTVLRMYACSGEAPLVNGSNFTSYWDFNGGTNTVATSGVTEYVYDFTPSAGQNYVSLGVIQWLQQAPVYIEGIWCVPYVQAAYIDAGAVTTAALAAGAVTADVIAAKAITVDKLTVANFDNLVPNPGGQITNPPAGSLEAAALVPANYVTQTGYTRMLQITDGTSQAVMVAKVPCSPGDVFSAQCLAVNGTGGRGLINVQFQDSSGADRGDNVSNDVPTNSIAATLSVVQAIAPSTAAYVALFIVQIGNGQTFFNQFYMRRCADANFIVDGAVTATKVAAGAITAQSMTLANTDNLIPNPNSEQPAPVGGWPPGAYEAAGLVSGIAHTGSSCRQVVSAGSGFFEYVKVAPPIPCSPGDIFLYQGWAQVNQASDSSSRVWLSWQDANRNELSVTFGGMPTLNWNGFQQFIYQGTAPANCCFVQPHIGLYAAPAGYIYYYDDLLLRRCADASLIVDGAINSQKLTTGSLQVGGAGSKPVEVQVTDSSNALVAEIGQFSGGQTAPWSGQYGGWFKNLGIGGSSPASPSLYVDNSGNMYGSNGAAIDYVGNLKLKNVVQSSGSPNFSQTVGNNSWTTLEGLNNVDNSALAVPFKGNPVLIGVNLNFLVGNAGATGPVTSIGWNLMPYNGYVDYIPPDITISISGNGSGASASVSWSQANINLTYNSCRWVPTLSIVGGSGYTGATATVTIQVNDPATGYSNGTNTYTCIISGITAQLGQIVQAQVLAGSNVILGPLQVASDATGNCTIIGTRLVAIPASTANISVQARIVNSTYGCSSTGRLLQVIELG